VQDVLCKNIKIIIHFAFNNDKGVVLIGRAHSYDEAIHTNKEKLS
jgi:hypothetical protein